MGGKRVLGATTTAVRRERAEIPRRGIPKGVWILLAAVALAASAVAVGCTYINRCANIFPGVSVAGVSLSGMSVAEAETVLDETLPSLFEETKIQVGVEGTMLGEYTLGDLGMSPLSEAMVQDAYAIGREGNWLDTVKTFIHGIWGEETNLPLQFASAQHSETIAQELAAQVNQDPVDAYYELTEEGLSVTKQRDGKSIDSAALIAQLQEVTPGNSQWIECPVTVIPATPLDVNAVAEEVHTDPQPARYDQEQGKVVDGTAGISVDPTAIQSALDAAEGGETVQVPVEVTHSDVTAQDIESVLFRDVLATYTTNVSGTSARKGNVELAGNEVNGTVLNAGEIFDYNNVVGKRTTERGFREAGTYVNGQTVNTVGGGICQVSSTIYMAALLSNLEIVERYNHRFYPGYIPLGMDATVSWGGPEFRFKNNTSYPIRIDVSYANSQLTVTIRGTKTNNNYVKMTYDLLKTTEYTTEYVETSDLPAGQQKQQQSGYTGYQVVTYRNIYDGSGNLISSNVEAKSTYSSRNQIILVGTGGKADTSSTATSDVSTTPSADTGTETSTPALGTETEPSTETAAEIPAETDPAETTTDTDTTAPTDTVPADTQAADTAVETSSDEEEEPAPPADEVLPG